MPPDHPFDDHSDVHAEHFEDLDLDDARLRGITFDDCTFTRCSLSSATLSDCTLSATRLHNCNLALARLPGTRLHDVAFVNACRALAHLLQRSGCRDEASRSAMASDSKARGEADDEL